VADCQTYEERLALRDGRRTLRIDVAEIDWVEAAGNYVQIYTERRTHLVRHTVKAMEDRLDPQRFVRVRPSAVVAVSAVAALHARVGGDYLVVMRDGAEIRTSRGYRKQVESALAEVPGTARELWAARRRRRDAAAARPVRTVAPTAGVSSAGAGSPAAADAFTAA
jgi:hypothetical protein